MEEWKEYKALDFCYNVTDGTHDSPKPKEDGHYLITSKHLKDGGIDFASAKKISENDYYKVIQRSKVEQYDILYSMIGTIGNICQVTEENVDFAVKNMGIFKMGGDKLKSKWLYYWLKSPISKHYVSSRLAGSTQSYLTLNSLREYPILVPNNESTMKKIVSILSSLDDKIETNRRINEHLEELAQALFKSWFVDFEPFKDGNFVESELGMIPEGWKVGLLDEVSKLIAGGDKPSIVSTNKTDKTQYPIYSNGIDNYGLYGYSDNYRIKEESVTVSARGTVGYVCLREEPYTPIVRLISVIPNLCFVSAKFIYHSLRTKTIVGTGTTQQQLTVPMFRKTLLVIPPKDIVDSFTIKVDSLFALRKKNQQEITHLTNLRDTLLPKLMSGEIDVNEVEI